jgi:hypothetical protein
MALKKKPKESHIVEQKDLTFVEKVLKGCASYDEKIHIQMLGDIFSKGGSQAEFRATAFINRLAFYNWLKKYPNFAFAYEVATALSEIQWEGKGMQKEVNAKWWQTMMANRFGYSEQRKLAIPRIRGAKDFSHAYRIILDHLAEGDLTGKEAQQLGCLISAGQKIEHDDRVKKMEEQIKQLSEIAGVPYES